MVIRGIDDMESKESGRMTLSECVSILQQDEPVRKKPPTTSDGDSVLMILQENAAKEGLIDEQIIQLVNLAASRKYSDATANSIIKCLIPRDQVPSNCAVNAVSWLCTNLLSVNLKVSFLKWLILVYDFIDDKDTVHSLYGILFLFLDNDNMSAYICHLLYLMTRKDDVKLYRLRKLQDLLTKVGAQPHLLGLLSLYKVYSPHLVPINIPKTKKVFFKPKDTKWLDVIWNVQSLKRNTPDKVSSSELNKEGILRSPAAKRRRKDVLIPSFQPHITDNDRPEFSPITVDQITSFKDLLTHFDKLELPNQMGTVLQSTYMQHLMVCTQNKGAFLRLNLWLHQTLHEGPLDVTELWEGEKFESLPRLQWSMNVHDNYDKVLKANNVNRDHDYLKECVPPILKDKLWTTYILTIELVSPLSCGPSARVTKFLQALLNLTSFLKEPIPAVENCLAQYLYTWNGVDYKPEILLLISHLRIEPFHRLNDLILEPLRKLFFSSSVQFKCQLLSCFTEMLVNMANSTLTFPVKLETSSIESMKSPISNETSLLKSGTSRRQTWETLKEFIGFVDRICVVALQLESDHVLLEHWVLCFFEQESVLRQQFNSNFVRIPSPAIVYRLLFATNPMACSRLCKLIVNYKEGFECLKQAKSNNDHDSEFLDGFESIGQFNQYILDISDSLWRNKAFVDRTKSLCYSIPRPITDALEIPHINERFSINNHAALVYIARKYLVQTQPEGVKLNTNLIRGRIRSVYLEFLRRYHLYGIITFLDTFIRRKVS